MRNQDNDGAWFAAKAYGYGAGLPIAWQGWVALFSYVGIMLLAGALIQWDYEVGLPVGIALIFISTVTFIFVCAAKTRGGWRWRWGKDD